MPRVALNGMSCTGKVGNSSLEGGSGVPNKNSVDILGGFPVLKATCPRPFECRNSTAGSGGGGSS